MKDAKLKCELTDKMESQGWHTSSASLRVSLWLYG